MKTTKVNNDYSNSTASFNSFSNDKIINVFRGFQILHEADGTTNKLSFQKIEENSNRQKPGRTLNVF